MEEEDAMISWMKLQLLSQRKRIIRPQQTQVRYVYINILQVSNMGEEFILGLLDSLQENILDLSGNEDQRSLRLQRKRPEKIYDKFVPKSLRYNFPTTNSQGYINFLLGNLKLLLSSKADSIAPLKHHIESVLDELLLLRNLFSEYQIQGSEEEQLFSCLWTCFKDVAYMTQFLSDSFSAYNGDDALWFYKLGLFDVKGRNEDNQKRAKSCYKHLK
ncbi:hypothetical protein M9H77_34110 [Catharanthus roseus]|uniref:Uncharacterized protein n=1 Tax=Catharanthus roseus TaxID=4058 RepID=A0ACB9ZKZ8_CATRO|nr:hypothetical protein M9H77_34110 [Catharanthus roseus]